MTWGATISIRSLRNSLAHVFTQSSLISKDILLASEVIFSGKQRTEFVKKSKSHRTFSLGCLIGIPRDRTSFITVSFVRLSSASPPLLSLKYQTGPKSFPMIITLASRLPCHTVQGPISALSYRPLLTCEGLTNRTGEHSWNTVYTFFSLQPNSDMHFVSVMYSS